MFRSSFAALLVAPVIFLLAAFCAFFGFMIAPYFGGDALIYFLMPAGLIFAFGGFVIPFFVGSFSKPDAHISVRYAVFMSLLSEFIAMLLCSFFYSLYLYVVLMWWLPSSMAGSIMAYAYFSLDSQRKV